MDTTEQTLCYCGTPTDSIHGGRYECGNCWGWRKLDSPAASHWERVANEFLSNVDSWDISNFLPSCGLSQDEIKVMLYGAKRVAEHSKAMLEAPTNPKRRELVATQKELPRILETA